MRGQRGGKNLQEARQILPCSVALTVFIVPIYRSVYKLQWGHGGEAVESIFRKAVGQHVDL
jgi:hypothetical protein